MIAVTGLRIAFEGKIVIDGIDFSVEEGKSLVLVGKNGSGKSVILKALAGLIDDYSGSIEINGQDIKSLYSDRYSIGTDDLNRFRIAYVFQKGGLFDSMNVFENIAFGLRRMDVDESSIQDIVTNSLARVGLSGSEEKLPSELSGGMQKRVGLARAVCLSPNIIFFDDPTAGLDPILSDTIADLILEIRESLNTTSIIVTHDMKVAARVADMLALLYRGKIVFQGKSDDFFSAENAYASQFIEGDIEGPIDIF
jgi:phospholipid/cholesterol/gamma-HCH transport system ATP-binding protein